MSGKGGRANPLESPFIDHWLLVVTLSLVSALLFLLLLPLVNQAFHWHLLAIHPLTIAIALFVVTTICLLPVMRSKDENSQLGYFGVALVTLIVLCICLAKLAIQTLFDIILFFIWPFEAIKITCLFSVLFLCRRYYMKCFSMVDTDKGNKKCYFAHNHKPAASIASGVALDNAETITEREKRGAQDTLQWHVLKCHCKAIRDIIICASHFSPKITTGMAISQNQPTLFLLNDTLTNSPVTFTAASIAKYYPENTSFWMYAMIGLGSSFMVFVALTIYLLCKPEKDSRRPNYSTYTTS